MSSTKNLTTDEIERKFATSQDRQILNEIVEKRLLETGWTDQVRRMCDSYIKEHGSDSVTVDELIAGVRQSAYKAVPDKVKSELLKHVERYVNDLTGGILSKDDEE